MGGKMAELMGMITPGAYVGLVEVVGCSDRHLVFHYFEHHAEAVFSPPKSSGGHDCFQRIIGVTVGNLRDACWYERIIW